MIDTLKRLMRLATGYSLVTFIGPLFTILLTPVYTRVLTPADYGVVDVCLTLSGLIGIFVGLGMDQALNSHFFDGDEARRRNVVTTALIIATCLGVVAATGLVLMSRPLAIALFDDSARYVTLWFAAIVLMFAPLYGIAAAALRLRMGVRRVNALGLTYLLALVGLSLLLVVGFRLKATGVVAANGLAAMIGAVTGIALLWKPLRGNFDTATSQTLIKTGIGLMPSILGLVLLNSADRLILTQYVSQDDWGLYSIANRLASMLSVLFNVAIVAWVPMGIEMSASPAAPAQFARIYEYFLAGACLVALAMGQFAPNILALFTTAQFVPAAPYATMLMAYFGPIVVSAALFSVGLYARKQTHVLALAYLVAAPLNIILNLILDPRIGILGAVWATLVGGVALALVTYVLCQRVYFVRYRWLRASALMACYVVLIGLSLARVHPVFDTLGWKVVSVCVMAGAPFALGIFSINQIRFAGNFLARRILPSR